MTETESVTFTAGSAELDRASQLRDDAETLLDREDTLLLPLARGRLLIDLNGSTPRLGWVRPEPEVLENCSDGPVFLGLFEGRPRFAAELPEPGGPRSDQASHGQSKYIDLRSVAGELSPAEASIAATAKGLLGWHSTHRFCSRCGEASEMQNGGWRRGCRSCGSAHFPRTDPVVIMLILRADSVLLGRQAAWPPGLYSLLAGFMEPGEGIEDAVRRETLEESGIEVGQVRFLGCQPWPFPSSLMLGCIGEATSTKIKVDTAELEDARWVGREDMRVILEGQHPDLASPRRDAIARAILSDWVNGDVPCF